MKKKYQPLDEKTSKELSSLFKDLFGNEDPFDVFKREYKPLPLKKRGNIEYEVQWHIADLEKDGHKIIHIAQNRFGETVMIYRLMYGDGLDDETINLRVKVISKEGVNVPDSNAYLHSDIENKQHLRIADIKIEGPQVNRGYGSILMAGVMKLVHEMQINYMTGWISSVDWDHIDRSEHFYRKHGFDVELNHETKYGTIMWVNAGLGDSKVELKQVDRGFPEGFSK